MGVMLTDVILMFDAVQAYLRYPFQFSFSNAFYLIRSRAVLADSNRASSRLPSLVVRQQ